MLYARVLAALLAAVTVGFGAPVRAQAPARSYLQPQVRIVPQRVSRTRLSGFYQPAHHKVVQRATWVAGGTRRVWMPALFETRFDACGRPYRVLVRSSGWRVESLPGRYERRPVRIWVAGRWSAGYR